ncbi:DUF5666 domain-containing protein [Methylocella sp.]|uniref:DUF5666 domain-containing protein n=1 Tax=Methylocella sp. TaxID=1978226 RepID=UPI0035B27057
MKDRRGLTRRRLFSALLGAAGFGALSVRVAADPRSQGQGGSAPGGDLSDRGIGGTGVVGTIRGFGSIIVNGMRISYPQDAEVRIDDAPASAADLRVGQVVRTVALDAGKALTTRRIDVTSEVVGPIEKAQGGALAVLGQRVALPAGKGGKWRAGDFVAVSGLRRPDGAIAASLVEKRAPGVQQIVGPVGVLSDGALAIGGMRLSGIDPTLVGRRVLVRGTERDGAFAVSQAQDETALFGPGVRALSMEAYVERTSSGLVAGSGVPLDGALAGLPLGQPTRAIVTATRGAQGWRVDSVRESGGPGGAPGGAPRGGGGPAGGGPSGGGPAGGSGSRGPAGGFGGGPPGGFDPNRGAAPSGAPGPSGAPPTGGGFHGPASGQPGAPPPGGFGGGGFGGGGFGGGGGGFGGGGGGPR